MQLIPLRLKYIIPLLLGVFTFLLTVGISPLMPTYVGWILGRLDPTQHYLGWIFYRNSEWAMPIGLNPKFGLDISSSIVYSDTIPLLAIPFKLLSPLLPSEFQYFGIWILICFVMQSIFAWKIISLFTSSTYLRTIACIFFIFSPPLLWRLYTPAGGHASLIGHFLILWAIYLSLINQSHKLLNWITLLSISILVHFYIFVIILVIWISNLLNQIYIKKIPFNIKRILFEIISVAICIALFSWQAGYFTISASLNNDRGYGYHSMNIMGPIDPQGWSYLWPGITSPNNWGEGFSFIGLGLILSSILSLVLLTFSVKVREEIFQFVKVKYPLFSMTAIAFTIFAISNNVGIGSYSITFSLPSWIISILDSLRSSARMFWPVYYMISIATCFIIIRNFSHKYSLIILGFFAALQVIDTSRGWHQNKELLSEDKSYELYSPKLKDAFWESAASRFRNIALVSVSNMPPHWEQYALYAAKNMMGTNSVHFARIDQKKIYESNQRLEYQIDTGNLHGDTLYILEDQFIISAIANSPSDTVIAKIDDVNVVIPGWKNCNECLQPEDKKILRIEQFSPQLNGLISFSDKSKNNSFYLRSGWSWPEDWGTWSDGKNAVLNFPWPQKSPNLLKIGLNAFIGAPEKYKLLSVSLNGKHYDYFTLSHEVGNEIKINLSEQNKANKYLSVEFIIISPQKPYDLNINNMDKRNLGVGITYAIFE